MKNVMETLKNMMGDGRKKAEEATAPADKPEESAEKEKSPVKEEEVPETMTVRGGYNPEPEEKPALAVPMPEARPRREVLRERVLEYLNGRHLKYEIREDSERLFHAFLNFRLQGRMNTCGVIFLATDSDIEAIAVAPLSVAEEYRACAAEFMMRANYGLKLGAFELDFRDGEVRFKSTLSSVAGVPSPQDVARILSMPVIMMERYGEGLVKCMMGLGDPEEEIRKIVPKQTA
ncbi:MAG: YbjN domain-containing protein [Clostridiales bacterium]|nr:YbjN domain-containing protein [Clostridiales bacterium]